MRSVNDREDLMGHPAGATIVKEFKSLEEYFTRKIDELTESECCKNELAFLFNNRGHAKYMMVEFDSAVEDYDRALQLNPSLAVAYFNRATICYRMGNFKDALSDLQKAVALEPSNPEFIEGYTECVKMNDAR